MRPLFQPQLVNPPTGDPALFVDVQLERRALLFDLGDIVPLSGRKLLRISDVFISHTHMDHFAGFDRLLRVRLGREKALRLFGPPGFIDRVEHKLGGYTWNLVDNYASDFTLFVTEIAGPGAATCAEFHTQRAFRRERERPADIRGDVLLAEPRFQVRFTLLDHRIPCLAFALEERRHANIWKNRLRELGLAPGPWLRQLKHAVLDGLSDDHVLPVQRHDGQQAELPLSRLREAVVVSPGQKLVYVADNGGGPTNDRRIVALAAQADQLFIEATFLERDQRHAVEKSHLTARHAGELARQARVRQVRPFHFSARYEGRTAALEAEVREALLESGDG